MSTAPDAPASDAAAPAVPARGRRRPARVLAVAVVAVTAMALTGALGAPVLRQRMASAVEPAPAARTVAQAAQATPTPTPTPTPASSDDPEATFEVYSVRDPFTQLVTLPEAEDGSGTGGGTSPDPTTSGGSVPGGGSVTGGGSGTTGSGSTPDPGSTPSTDGSGGGSSPTTGPTELDLTRVELVDTFVEDGADKALVTVNGQGYEVAEGQAFATGFTLVAVDAPCVTLAREGRRFLLCEGDDILK